MLKHYEPTILNCPDYYPNAHTVDTLEEVTCWACQTLGAADPGLQCDHGDPCACYGEGYATGKGAAHLEIRTILDGGHAQGCGCEPCLTVRAVLSHARTLKMRE